MIQERNSAVSMKLVSKHGNGTPHRIWTKAIATPDVWSFYVPANSPVLEASGKTWSSPYPVVAMFWPREFYQVFMLLKEETTEYYCNIIAPVRYAVADCEIQFFDLDLDVLVTASGPKVLDEPEFEVRSKGYPVEWVNGALNAKTTLMRWAENRLGPFAPATAEGWRAWAGMQPEM